MVDNINYKIIETIQTTSKGSVYVAKNNSMINKKHKTVIIKTFVKSRTNSFILKENNNELIPKEMYFINLINDESICPIILDCFQSETDFSIVMENLDGKWIELYEYTGKKRMEKCLRRIIFNTILALQNLVKKGIYYLDIKPSNIVFHKTTYCVKLLDFEDALHGLENENPVCKKYVGTIGYCSPEVFLKTNYDVKKSIVFMIGTLIYSCIESIEPFEDKNDYKNIETLKFEKCSVQAKDLIKKCILRDPNERIEFDNIINHDWFNIF